MYKNMEIEIDYEKQQKALEDAVSKIAKDSGSKVAKKLMKRQKGEYSECKRLSRMLLDETLDMYESGEAWPKLVDDLAEALKVIET